MARVTFENKESTRSSSLPAKNQVKDADLNEMKASINALYDEIEQDDIDITGKEDKINKDATGGYVGLTLFKINFKNALNTITSFFTNSNTVARTYTFQDRNGTIADDTDLAAKENSLPTMAGQSLKVLRVNALETAKEWHTIESGLTIGTTPITSGTTKRVLFQDGSVVSQSANFVFDASNQLVIGGHTGGSRIDVKAGGALSTDLGFRVRNSADTANILMVNGVGQVWSNGKGAQTQNTGFGQLSLNSCTTGNNNTAYGYNALATVTTGTANTAIGCAALQLTTGAENTAVGFAAGQLNAGGYYNTYLGVSAGQYGSTASGCTFIGYAAGQSSNAQYGVFIGYTASITGGNGTVAIGYLAGAGTGAHNLSLGQQSGSGMTTGSFNTHLGYRSVASGITTGNYNNLLGSDIVVGAVSNTAVLADNQGNIAIRKDANHFVGVGYSGTATLGAKLDVKAQGALVTNLALRVRNSADTDNLFVVKGNGVLNAANLPTSATGLVTGDIWNNLGILTIV